MSSNTQDQILETFVEAAGGALQRLEAVAGGTIELAHSLGTQLAGDPRNATREATGGVYVASATPIGTDVHSTQATAKSTGGAASTAGSIASTFFESGFGMAALVKGLLGLFGGGEATPPPLTKYEMPSSILFESAETAGGISGVDYDQFGRPRASASGSGEGGYAPGAAGVARPQQASPQITVNVQAMDAQSFLDHSGQIAQAVRGAMLNLSAINDVVNEL